MNHFNISVVLMILSMAGCASASAGTQLRDAFAKMLKAPLKPGRHLLCGIFKNTWESALKFYDMPIANVKENSFNERNFDIIFNCRPNLLEVAVWILQQTVGPDKKTKISIFKQCHIFLYSIWFDFQHYYDHKDMVELEATLRQVQNKIKSWDPQLFGFRESFDNTWEGALHEFEWAVSGLDDLPEFITYIPKLMKVTNWILDHPTTPADDQMKSNIYKQCNSITTRLLQQLYRELSMYNVANPYMTLIYCDAINWDDMTKLWKVKDQMEEEDDDDDGKSSFLDEKSENTILSLPYN